MTPGRIAASRVNTTVRSRTEDGATYQNTAVAVASPRMDADAFVTGLQLIARKLLFSAVEISEADRQFLYDVARGEGRYQMQALKRFIAISSRSVKPEDREALPELIRGEILVTVPVVRDVALAFDLETQAQGEADVAQRLYERRPCRTTREVAVEKLTLHSHALRASLDAVAADRS